MRGLFFVCFWVYIVRYQWGLGGDPQKKSETGKCRSAGNNSWYFLVGEFEIIIILAFQMMIGSCLDRRYSQG